MSAEAARDPYVTCDLADAPTIASILRRRAQRDPDRLAYAFLSDAGRTEERLTYGELDRRARACAAALRRAGAGDGQRALLLFPPGVDFVVAFLGCLYAGTVAVPAYPPDPFRLDRTLPRLTAIVGDATPVVALTTAQLLGYTGEIASRAAGLAALRWIAVDEVPDGPAGSDTGADGPAGSDTGADGPAGSDTGADGAPPTGPALLQYTSGSTGDPKGVVLSDANLLHNLGQIREFFRATDETRGLIWLPPYHDMGLIGGLLQPLHGGFPVWLMSPLEFLSNPLSWLQAISRVGATMSGGPNFAYDLCVRKTTREQRAALDLSSWQVAFNGAEPVRPDTMARFAEAFAPSGFDAAAFLPCYGLAEATLIVTGGGPVSTAGHVDPAALERGEVLPDPATPRPLSSCGSSAPDQRVVIVDPHTRLPCPAGRVGEVWVAGPSVAHGYWRKPDETRATFGATLAGTGDGPFLRTGDLGFLRDAELVVTGRLTDLLIIRGRNHYPHDIELTAERAHPAVRPGCSAAFLVADELVLVHEVARGSEGIDIGTVAAAVRAAVAQDHDVRVGSVVLLAAGAMPKTSSGKVRRRDCRVQLQAGELAELGRTAGPEQGAGAVVLTRDVLLAAAPQRRRELLVEYLLDRTALVCGAAAEVDRPLVATGLDSLAAQQLGQLVDDELGTAVPLGEILGGATAHDIADRLATGLTATPAELPPAPAPPEGALTHGQRSLWFLDRLGNCGTAYTTVAAVRLRGLDGPALAAAFDAVVARHGALRTTFAVRDGEPHRVVHERALPGAYTEIDATALPHARLSARLEEDANAPFDLASGPLARLRRYRCTDADGDGYDVVVLAAHHIVTDVRSMRIVVRDLGACYDDARLGRPSGGPDGPTYQDVVAWEEQLLAGPERARLEGYWDEQLRGGDAALRLPRLRAGSPSSRAGTHSFRIGAELTARIRERAAAEGVTLNMALLAAFQTLLHSLTGQEELAVGTPVAARTRRDLDDVAGYRMNPVVVRSHAPRTDSFRQLLLRTRAQVAGAVSHQAYPVALLAQRHAAFRHGGLYRAMFVFNQPTAAELAEPGVAMLGYAGIRRSFGPHQVESVAVARRDCAEDVELTMSDIDGEVHATLLFRLDVLDADNAALFARRLTDVLDAVATDPGLRLGSLPRAGAEERERVLRTWSTAGVRGAAPAGRVDDLVAERARSAPSTTAVVAGPEEWTYAQLDEHANRLARQLRAAGVGTGQRVGLCLERSPQLVAAMLGVLRTGAAYVPADPANPRDRIAAVLADAEVTAVVSQDVLTGKLPELGVPLVLPDVDLPDVDLPDVDLPDVDPTDVDGAATARRPGRPPSPPAGPDACAYVIYTSGSTGAPKGVDVRHGGLATYVSAFVRDCAVGPADRVLQFSSAGFDASAEEIYGALTSGATLVLRTDAMLASPEAFLRTCGELGITVLCVATSYWHELMVGVAAGTARVPECVRLVVIGGEKALPEHVATWHEHVGARVRLHNTYGPTEATIVAASWDVTAADGPGPVPIGRPVAGTRIYLLDADLEPVPPGVVGEMYIGGAGVAQGYRGRPSLTAERFVADPFGAQGDRTGGGRLYRTGDRARHRPDGTLVFVDRADRQVKIAGHRIELGEIESALRALPGIADAVVARRDGGLAAYVVPADAAPVDEQGLRTALRAALPAYMVPARYAVVPGFPRTPNGKLDIAALPEPALPTTEGPADPPRTPEEHTLAGIWADVLGVPVVHRDADFFALGGHSLLATKVLARVGELMGRELPLRVVFESPTLAGLAQRLADAPPAAVTPIPRTSRDEQVPLAFVQEQIWFLEQFEPGSANYNVPRSLRVHGAVDPEVVAAVFADLEVRHEILRTTFPDVDGVPVQLVHPPRGIPVPVIDSSAFAAGHDATEVVQHVREIILERGREPFDLAAGPLLRVALVRLAADDHVLVVVEHHLLHDGWAQGVFLRDFLALFAARAGGPPARLPELPIQYADFAAWQRCTLRDDRLRDLLGYWVAQLDGAPGMLGLPTDRPRTEVRTQRGAEERLAIDAELAQRLGGFGREHGASLFMTMFAAFSALMSGYTGKDDLVLGTGIANRQRPELENLLGMMINTVVLRADVAGDPSFLTLLERTRRTCLEAYAHQELPFSVLVDRLRPDRDTSHMPVIQVMFSFLDTPLPPMEVPGLRFEVIEVHNRTAKFDMNVVVMVPPEYRGSAGAESVAPSGQGITVLAEYNTDLFDAATIRLMVERYETLLRAVLAHPGRPVTAHLRGIGLDALPLGTS